MKLQAVNSRAMSAKLRRMPTRKTVFGHLPLTARQLIAKLKLKIPWSGCPITWKTRRLTNKIFSDLKEIGKDCGATSKQVTPKKGIKRLKSFFTGNRRRRAFLLDFLWWMDGFGTALAVESELSDLRKNAFQHDFEKLLCWKSPMKLFIVRETKEYDAQKIADDLSQYARDTVRQLVENECYLLFVIGCDNHRNQWFMYRASQNHCDLPDNHCCSAESEYRCFKFTPYHPSETTRASTTRQRRRRGRH